MKKRYSKNKTNKWLVAFLIIFYPIGLIYLIVLLCKKLAVKAPTVSPTPTPAPVSSSATVRRPSNSPSYLTPEWQAKYEEHKKQQDEFLRKKRAEFDAELEAIPRAEIVVSQTKAKRNLVSDMPEFTYKNITKATPIDKIFPLVVVDTETTGLKVSGGDIIEVSAIKFDKGFVPISCFTTLLKPRKPIPPEATKVNGITDEMVSECPMFSEIAASFSEYIDKCTIVGHNLPFDVKFLHACGATLPFKSRFYDTLQIARSCLKKGDDVYNYKLDTLCEYYRIYRSNSHRSLSDCLATAKVFDYLIAERLYR